MYSDNLERFLSTRFLDWNNIEVSNTRDITSGWETDILSFDVEYTKAGSRQKQGLIARIYPNPHGKSRSYSEYYLLESLAGLGYPVPKVYALEQGLDLFGRAFIIMERIDGTTMWAQFEECPDAVPQIVHRFIGLFVQLHSLDYSKSPHLIERFQERDFKGLFSEYLRYERTSLAEDRVGYLIPLVEWMVDNLPRIEPLSVSLLHRDFHPENILVDGNDNAFVIDWTAARTGDPRTDLAWSLLLSEIYSGEDFSDMILDEYKRQSGVEIEDLDFFTIEACLRRLSDILISFEQGASAMGMREETIEVMKSQIGNLTKVHDIVEATIGTRIHEIDRKIETYSV